MLIIYAETPITPDWRRHCKCKWYLFISSIIIGIAGCFEAVWFSFCWLHSAFTLNGSQEAFMGLHLQLLHISGLLKAGFPGVWSKTSIALECYGGVFFYLQKNALMTRLNPLEMLWLGRLSSYGCIKLPDDRIECVRLFIGLKEACSQKGKTYVDALNSMHSFSFVYFSRFLRIFVTLALCVPVCTG